MNASTDTGHARSPGTESGQSDRALVKALLAGDRAAGELLLERNYERVYGSLVKLTGDQDLAADLTQDAFQRAWSSLRAFRGEAAFFSWMYRIAYTTYLNHIRKPHLLQPVDDLEAHASEAHTAEEPAENAFKRLSRSESEQRLRNAVVALPDRQRMAITARFWGDLSTSEIAALENVSAVAIRKRIRLALASLAAQLETESNKLHTFSCAGGSAS